MKKGKKTDKEISPNSQPSLLQEPEGQYQTYPSSRTGFANTIPSLTTLLGKQKNIPQSIDSIVNKHQYISLIREGVKMQTLERLVDAIELTTNEVASIMHTSERTLRRYTSDTILNPGQTERVIELARLFSRGSEVFGSLNNFNTWMNSKVLALGNIQPKALLDTSLGIEVLLEELGRIEHGIFA